MGDGLTWKTNLPNQTPQEEVSSVYKNTESKSKMNLLPSHNASTVSKPIKDNIQAELAKIVVPISNDDKVKKQKIQYNSNYYDKNQFESNKPPSTAYSSNKDNLGLFSPTSLNHLRSEQNIEKIITNNIFF